MALHSRLWRKSFKFNMKLKNVLLLNIVLLILSVEKCHSSDIEEITSLSPIDTDESSTISNSEPEKPEEKPFLLPTSVKPVNYRLEIIPLLFEVENYQNLPYLNASKFHAPGKVWISITLQEKTSNITLHAHDDILIDTNKIKVFNINTNETITINNVTRDNETDFLVLHLNDAIGDGLASEQSKDLYMVYIEFTSRIADDRLNGLYLDYYIEPKSMEKRFLSTSLFAPNHARKAFPCFDSPGFKATFDISIGKKDNTSYSSISNMPISHTVPIPELTGWVFDVFQQTPPLPTYIVALISTDFSYRSIKSGDIEFRLYAPDYLLRRTKQLNLTERVKNNTTVNNPNLLQDPLLYIVDMLLNFQFLTDLASYPLAKLDVIALPHFYFNAMENMGAVTFKYPVILNVEGTTTTSDLMRLSYVAGHEIAHQWFGNMLTPKSWTYVWLKESFSDYLGALHLAQTSGFDFDEFFATYELQRAMRFDAGANTHPLENHIKSAAAVAEIYTDIPYRKGASIVYMISNFLTEKVFRQGLKSLFDAKKFSNIDQNDLFEALEEKQQESNILASQGLTNITVNDILNSWTQQSGYPVVRVRREKSNLILTQEKFKNGLLIELKAKDVNETKDSNNKNEDEPENPFWWIPLTIADGLGKKSIHWLHPNSEETIIKSKIQGKFNSIKRVPLGYFRVLYSEADLSLILNNLNQFYSREELGAYYQPEMSFEQLPSFLKPVERSQLVDDYFAFAFSGYQEVPVSDLFNVLSTILPYEGKYVVWKTLFTNMEKPYNLLQNTEFFDAPRKYLISYMKPLSLFLRSQIPVVISQASCSQPSHLTRKLKLLQFHSMVFSWLCKLDPEECSQVSGKAVTKFMQSGNYSLILADEQTTLYCNAMKTASESSLESLWSFFEKQYFEEPYSEQKNKYLKALSCVTRQNYLERLLTWTTNETLDFHDVDRVLLIKMVIANPVGRNIVWDFLDKNFNVLYKSSSVANPVTESLKYLVDYCNTNENLQKMENFIKTHETAMEKKKKFLEKQIKNSKLNILWMDTFAKPIQQSADNNLKNTRLQRSTCTVDVDNDEIVAVLPMN